jgi:hypothetical protein
MMKKRFLVALGALSAAASACSGSELTTPGVGGSAGSTTVSTGSTPGNGGSTVTAGGTVGNGGSPGTSGTATTGGSGPANGGTSQGGGTAGTGPVGIQCVPGVPESSQISRLLKREYDAVMRDLLNVTTMADGTKPSAGLYEDYTGPMNRDAWNLYLSVGEKIAHEVMTGANRTNFINCDPAVAGCLTDTVRAFGRKAFRRALTEEEVMHFTKLGQTTPAGTPEEVAEATLFGFLVSPSFLMKTELTTVPEGTAIKLSGPEVAARLSFLLWSSVPDPTLTQLADTEMLGTKEAILAQANRMIMDRAKTAPAVSAYHRRYLDMDNGDAHWWKVEHDTTKFPNYSTAAVPLYQAELDKFFEEVAFANGTFKDIFLSNVGFVNNQTAAIYGLDPALYGPELARVELDANTRPGFLTRVGFLQSYSHFEATSPILRGAYISINLIGVNPGAPDPNFFLQEPPPGTYYTERAFVEALTGQTACVGCHAPTVNPPGFVLENYDAIGAWQTTDQRATALGAPAMGTINATASVNFGNGDVQEISSARQMMEKIASLPKAKRTYAEKWVSFATGRDMNPNDACTADVIDGKLASDTYTVLQLLADLTQSDSFRLRVRGN